MAAAITLKRGADFGAMVMGDGDGNGDEMMEPAPWAADCESHCVPEGGQMDEAAGNCMMQCLMGGLCMAHMDPTTMPEGMTEADL